MKFGRVLHQHQIPEWAESYLDYNNLKKICKTITISDQPASSSSLSSTHFEIDIISSRGPHRVIAHRHSDIAHNYISYQLVCQLGLHNTIVCDKVNGQSKFLTVAELDLPVRGEVKLKWSACGNPDLKIHDTEFVVLESQGWNNDLVFMHMHDDDASAVTASGM